MEIQAVVMPRTRGTRHGRESNEGFSTRLRALFSSLSTSEPCNVSSSRMKDDDETSTLGPLEKALSRLLGDDVLNSHRLETTLKSFPNGRDREPCFSPIFRIEQLETWDCGIVSVLILLRWVQRSDCSSVLMSEEEVRLYQSLQTSIQTQSIWTADLVDQVQKLLQGSECRFLFCSKTFQVEESYKDVRYYQETFRADEVRVTSLFGKLLQEIGRAHV